MPWWAPLGGLVGAFAVIAGLMFVNKVGAGPFAGLTITANILMSLAIDHFGWFGMTVHPMGGWRVLGAALMVARVHPPAIISASRARVGERDAALTKLSVVTRAREAAPIPARSDADRPAPAGTAALRLLADVDISF